VALGPSPEKEQDTISPTKGVSDFIPRTGGGVRFKKKEGKKRDMNTEKEGGMRKKDSR